ncbi:hypothetical protein C8J57DRAFT_1080618, partial [Mycena rebaudengoi]
SYNAANFDSFINALLDNMNPFPVPNSVIMMDNVSIHKSTQLCPMIEQWYISLLIYLSGN